jgi:hypothetical protein
MTNFMRSSMSNLVLGSMGISSDDEYSGDDLLDLV